MTVAGEKIIRGLGQAIDHARSLDATAIAPAPWSWETVHANASGGFHLYLTDANGRKIAALWGGSGEKVNNAHLMALAPEVATEAQFLCDRLRELECSILDDEVGREYYGHASPSRARLEALLREARGEDA